MYSPTIPAVVERMLVEEPYRMLWLIPQYWLAGLLVVTGVYPIEPVYKLESVPPKVSSPLVSESDEGGA